MILSDQDIMKSIESGRLVISPLSDDAIQPVSVDLTLGNKLRVYRGEKAWLIDIKHDAEQYTEIVAIDELVPFILHPGAFALGITAERVELPADLMGRLDGKSSLGRLGLLVHSTAGFIDPGFKGRIVLEFSNIAPLPITLYAGMKIAQISFEELSSPSRRPYGHKSLASKYQDQNAPVASKYHLNFSNENVRRPSIRPMTLKEWIQESRFNGNLEEFSVALGVPSKTVQNWISNRYEPNPANRAKIYTLTRLPQYRSRQVAQESGHLLTTEDT